MSPAQPPAQPPARAALASVVALALPLGGCEEIDPYLPKARFDRLDVKSVTFEAVEADFVFAVDNPNPVDIKLARFDYALAFEEVEFLTGDDPDGLELVGDGATELALPVGFTFEGLYELVQATRGEDVIDFALAGSFGFDTPAGIVDLPYDADGDFPALRTPSFQPAALRVEDLDFTGATLELDLDVDNDHGSNLVFQQFDYALDLEGSRVASGLVAELGEVSGATEGTLTLPFDVSFADAGAGIYEALSGGDPVDVGLSAATEVDTPFGVLPLSVDESGTVSMQ